MMKWGLMAILFAYAALAQPPAARMSVTRVVTPQAMLQAMYRLPDVDLGAFADAERRSAYFSERLVARVSQAEACNQKRYGYEGLDVNPLIPASDYALSHLRIELMASAPQRARWRVRFRNFEEPMTLDFDFILSPQGWRIDEVRWDDVVFSAVLEGGC